MLAKSFHSVIFIHHTLYGWSTTILADLNPDRGSKKNRNNTASISLYFGPKAAFISKSYANNELRLHMTFKIVAGQEVMTQKCFSGAVLDCRMQIFDRAEHREETEVN